MKVTISKHAKERAAERGITEDGIRDIVGGAIFTVTTPNDSDPYTVFVHGEYNEKVWTVLFNIKTNNVITVRRAWTKEEAKYYGKKK